ncbi:MAG: iron-sulfur cluster assembly scaffold protein [Smithellaceae bacterium]|jgi:nitrogen fixation NifU-like protein|nr:iron-sulfur cluster assembly scaffold protein [Syntrophaceae bacterium]MBP8607797.1 iron-sulfur cluster assembly scaffold protein [Syntrophaceae bacterium]
MEVINLKVFHLTAIEHANDPRNMGPLQKFNGHARITGPCGDTMEFWLEVQNGKIKKASFITDGCGPSIASGSMTACLAEGKTVAEAKSISQKDVLEALEGLPEESQHCALLAVNTLKAACDGYMEKQKRKERF